MKILVLSIIEAVLINSTNNLKLWINHNSYFLVPGKMDGTIVIQKMLVDILFKNIYIFKN
ncbi:hypothetical protein BpHYR1_022688 [Brachionus plicatilis]|uniref:Uncharacterized protein n=1 Tax=Brachionus plicatilis TaxID=10195 RepID=A0A3M7SJZ5_BRAPC|nr:hypothetical protein BpHYR1_022688 [Brachionus plicatilis]